MRANFFLLCPQKISSADAEEIQPGKNLRPGGRKKILSVSGAACT